MKRVLPIGLVVVVLGSLAFFLLGGERGSSDDSVVDKLVREPGSAEPAAPAQLNSSTELGPAQPGRAARVEEAMQPTTQPPPDEIVVRETAGSARLSGRVIDDTGLGVTGVKVSWSRGDEARAITDSNGSFDLTKLTGGSGQLEASSDAGAAALSLTLEDGAHLEDLTLQIAAWGGIRGHAQNRDESPVPDAKILTARGLAWGDSTRTDIDGNFAFQRVTPGEYQVMLVAVDGAEFAVRGLSDDRDAPGFFENLWLQTIVVEPGEETWVTLSPPELNPVRVFGQVTSGGEPVEEASLFLVLEGTALLSSVRPAETDAEGMYEVRVRQPGPHILLAAPKGETLPLFWKTVNVSLTSSLRADVDLPATAIRGRVLDGDGKLVESAIVTLRPETGLRDFHLPGASVGDHMRATGYEFEHIAPGRYTLTAYVPAGRIRVADDYAITVESGVDVRAGQVVELDLVLARGGPVRGLVTDANGAPVRSAGIYARDLQGRLLHRYPLCESDAKGRFETSAVPEGMVTLTARTPNGASAESGPIAVRPGATPSEVHLKIDTGTWLRVDTVDEEGDPVSATIRLYDELDRDVTDLRAPGADERVARQGFGTSWLLAGPLPKGVYRAEAVADDGRRGTASIRLDGEFEEVLEVEL